MSEKKYYGNTKKTTEQFIEEAKKIHGNKFDYSKVDYKNANTKVCIICPEHGEFFQRPISHLRGDKCPSCSGNKKLTSEQFIKKSNEIHNNKFDYSKVDYKNHSTKVCIICPEHGEFWQTPNSHLSGKGCPKCGYIKITNKNTKWDYEKCYELAQKCKSKKEFREKYPKLYRKSLKKKWIKDYIWLKSSAFKIDGKIDSVYCYIFDDVKSVYVGRTLMREQKNRDKNHNNSNRSSVFKFATNNNLKIPSMQILEENLTLEEGQIKEDEWCKKFQNNGYTLINIALTGKGVGSIGALSTKWTYKRCYKEAQKYKYKIDFINNSHSAYIAAHKNGWFNDYTWLKNKINHWTHKKVKNIAKKYTTLLDFKLNEGSAYNYARKNNLLEKFTWLKRQKNHSKRIVLQIDKNTNKVMKELEIGLARKQFGYDVTQVCKGKRKTCGGFKWAYKDEYDLKNNIKE